ncbi:MAG: hypothetical protein ACLPSY_07925 [Steroidobacteraceae bacterium]
MTNDTYTAQFKLANQQGARALLIATFDFLNTNNISVKEILKYAREHRIGQKANGKFGTYKKMLRAYEDMGVLMSTWFSQPRFLDKSGSPLSLTVAPGPHSIANLIRFSRVRVATPLALDLMRRSPSVKFNADGTLLALRRVFVLPEFEVPRAALVIERYLDTLRRNASGRKKETTLLLERSCHASEVDLRKIALILRDIKGRGTAFMDSVDGEIEACRRQRSKRHSVGKLGVLVFAWSRPDKS